MAIIIYIFSMDNSEITEHFLISLFFLIFMKISELRNGEIIGKKGHSVFSCELQSSAQMNQITKELNSSNVFFLMNSLLLQMNEVI